MNRMSAVLIVSACIFWTSKIFADTSTVDVTIDSVNGEARMVKVLYSGKPSQLKIADDADIEINGKKSQCDSLVVGDKAVVTFDKQRKVITKIVVTREAMIEESGPFDSETSDSSPDNANDDSSSEGDGKAQTVIAEGVGASADDAVKDAFRNAVKQVVGAVVDAEALLKNDELIDDQVLTYSDGFVKKFTEVEGSKKVSGGLHRIKIKADVERRSVIAKLKAAKISVKEVDGKSMFAEVVSQLDAEKDAAALLTKQFEGFPLSYITASVVGEPKVLDKNDEAATIQVVVHIEPDLEAFKAFAKKLTAVLEKMAIDKGEFSAVSGYDKNSKCLSFGDGAPLRWIPTIWRQDRREEDIFAVAVAESRSKLGDKLECKCFQIDSKLRQVLINATQRLINVKLEFIDSDGEAVITERVLARDGNYSNSESASDVLLGHGLAWYFEYYSRPVIPDINRMGDRCKLVFLGPTFLRSPYFNSSSSSSFLHLPTLDIPISTKVSLDELKSFKDVKVELYTE